ncbi:MAG: hypothetical protein R3B70_30190 [Polyangiaceae bacterium]
MQKGRPIAVDVTLGTFDLAGGESGDRATSMFDGTETQQRLLGRDVTHFLALPLRSTGGSVDGMLCVEATCRSAIGRPFIWPDCREHLQMLAGMAAPYLTTLPRGVVAAPAADELLPVVGASMAEVVSLVAVFARQRRRC